MASREAVFGAGDCIGQEELFEDPDNVWLTGPMCEVCPVLDECSRQIGSRALRMATYRSPVDGPVYGGVIAGTAYQLYTRRPLSETTPVKQFPDEPADALQLVRETCDGIPTHATKMTTSLLTHRDAMAGRYRGRHGGNVEAALGKEFVHVWTNLANALRLCGPVGLQLLYEQPDRADAIGELLVTDTLAIRKLGVRRAATTAMHHPAAAIKELYETTIASGDASRAILNRLLSSDPIFPEIAVRDYLARLRLFRRQYRGRDDVTDRQLTYACSASATDYQSILRQFEDL